MYNKATLIGNLGSEPKLEKTKAETLICRFPLATHSGTKEKKETQWHNIVVFGGSAENCAKYLKKGESALIEGEIRSRKWKGKDEKEHTTYEIVASNVTFMGKGTKNGVGEKVETKN